jgi:hypothetical protein
MSSIVQKEDLLRAVNIPKLLGTENRVKWNTHCEAVTGCHHELRTCDCAPERRFTTFPNGTGRNYVFVHSFYYLNHALDFAHFKVGDVLWVVTHRFDGEGGDFAGEYSWKRVGPYIRMEPIPVRSGGRANPACGKAYQHLDPTYHLDHGFTINGYGGERMYVPADPDRYFDEGCTYVYRMVVGPARFDDEGLGAPFDASVIAPYPSYAMLPRVEDHSACTASCCGDGALVTPDSFDEDSSSDETEIRDPPGPRSGVRPNAPVPPAPQTSRVEQALELQVASLPQTFVNSKEGQMKIAHILTERVSAVARTCEEWRTQVVEAVPRVMARVARDQSVLFSAARSWMSHTNEMTDPTSVWKTRLLWGMALFVALVAFATCAVVAHVDDWPQALAVAALVPVVVAYEAARLFWPAITVGVAVFQMYRKFFSREASLARHRTEVHAAAARRGEL